MTAQTPRRKPEASEGGQAGGRIRSLMREMGSPSGQFTGVPPDQHKWQLEPGPHNPPLHRMWSCMIYHTCFWGHESPYAISSTRDELHMENLAKLLGMDLANAYRTWREGVKLGIWRNGTRQEGTRKLYLCGKVEPQTGEDEGEEKENQIVCTDNLPPYLRKIVNGWDAPRAAKFRAGWLRQTALRNTLCANQMAAARFIADQSDDSFFKAWGLDKTHIVRDKFAVDEHLVKAAKSHFESIAPAVLREIALEEATDRAWDALSELQRGAMVNAAAAALKGEWLHGRIKARGWDSARWDSEAQKEARRQLRREIEARPPVENGEAELSVHTNLDSVQSAGDDGYGPPDAPGTAAHPYSRQHPERGQISEQSLHLGQGRQTRALQPPPPEVNKQVHTPPPQDSFSAEDEKIVFDAVQTAWGSPLLPGDDVPKKLLELAAKQGCPVRPLCLWLERFAKKKESAGYTIESARLFVTAAEEGQLAAWMKANRSLVELNLRMEAGAKQGRRGEDCRQLFTFIPAWQKLLPGGPVIGMDVTAHVDGVLAVVDALRGADVLAFGIYVDSRLRGLTAKGMEKLPGGFLGGPDGPRLLRVLYEMAREFRADQARKGGRR